MFYDERDLLDASIALHKLGLQRNRDYCHFVISVHAKSSLSIEANLIN